MRYVIKRMVAVSFCVGLACEDSRPRDGETPENEFETRVFRPDAREVTPERLIGLTGGEGFTIAPFATGVGNVRMMVVTTDGTVYATRPLTGDVVMVKDPDGDGVADPPFVVASSLSNVHGIALRGNELYLATPKQILATTILPGGLLEPLRIIVSDLPDGGQHGRRTIRFGPDGFMYVSIGSSCNACIETNPEHATILRMKPDGSERIVFARGLRNTLGFDWNPRTGELWGMDQGTDDRGNDLPPEELNRVLEGRDYGWPFAFADRQVDPKMEEPPTGTKAERAQQSEPAVLTYPAHSSPIDFLFYRGSQFPGEFQSDAFVPMRGSWNRFPAAGFKLVRVRFQNGQPFGFEDFVTGWLIEDGQAHFGRIAGLALANDGALLLSEDTNGVIYRITHGSPGG